MEGLAERMGPPMRLRILGKISHQQERDGDGEGGVEGISAAWREEGGRERQSFIWRTVLDSEAPHLRSSGARGHIPPPKSGALLKMGWGGCKSLPSGCRVHLGQAKGTTEVGGLWLMKCTRKSLENVNEANGGLPAASRGPSRPFCPGGLFFLPQECPSHSSGLCNAVSEFCMDPVFSPARRRGRERC